MFKKVLIVLLVIFIAIQFIRPKKNIAAAPSTNDVVAYLSTPTDVQNILYKACYDCHSNTTKYPWYAEVQPVAWWLNNHIVDGKKELNFSEYASFSIKRQYKKMDEVVKQVKEQEMPLSSYTLIHKDADLTAAEREALINWASSVKESMKAKYPIDSLVTPKK